MGWTNKKTKDSFKLRNQTIYTNEEKPSITFLSNLKSIDELTLKEFLLLNFLPLVFIIYAIVVIILVLAFLM
jgi:hypothetical protein